MSKVNRIGVPKRLMYLSNAEIKDCFNQAYGKGEDMHRVTDEHTSEHFDKSLRISDQIAEYIKELSELTGYPQTFVTSFLIGAYHSANKPPRNEAERLVQRLEDLGYDVIITGVTIKGLK